MRLLAAALAAWLCMLSVPTHAQPAPKEIVTLASPAKPWSFVMSRDGRIGAAVCADYQLRVWTMADGRSLPSIDLGKREIYSMTISPDGRMLVAGDFAGEYSFWQTATGTEQAHLRLRFYPQAMAFSADGSRLAIAPIGEPVQVYDAATHQKLFELQRRVGGTAALAFSRDGSRLLAADADTVVRIYDARTGTLLRSNTEFLLEPLTAAFSADGREVMTGGGDKFVATIDAATGRTTKKSGKMDDPVVTLDVSPDGAWVATLLMHADNLTMPAPVIVTEAATGRRVSQWLPAKLAMWTGWTGDGRLLLATGEPDGVHIWRVR